MTLSAPVFLAALALLVPVLVAFLVKQRRNVLRVPSTMVWRLSARAVAKNRRIRDLQRLLALVLCMTAVAALAFAAARPSAGRRGGLSVFVVDVSASMSGKPIDDARRWLRREVASLGPGDRVAIVAAGGAARVHLPPSAPGVAVDDAIRALAALPGPSAMDDAIALADALAAESGRVVVLSDDAVDVSSSSAEHKPAGRVLGAPGRDNLGITALFTRSLPDARDDDEREATVAIATSSSRSRRARLIVEQNGTVVVDRVVDVPARGEVRERAGVRGGGHVAARVEAADRVSDALALDDRAELDEPVRKPMKVAVIGPVDSTASFFMDKALRAAGASDVLAVAEDGDAPKNVDLAVVLRDGRARPRDVPLLLMGVAPPELAIAMRDVEANEARLRSISSTDPLLRGVALDELTATRARVAVPPRGARVLVDLDGGPAVIAGGSGEHSWVWVGIDPEASDLVLRVAFPVLVGNVMAQLGGATQIVTAKTVPRAEVTLAPRTVEHALAGAPEPRWKLPTSVPIALAALAGVLLALEAWLSFRTQLSRRVAR